MQHTIAQVNGVVKPEKQQFRAKLAGIVLENALASKAGLGILAHRRRRHILRAPAGSNAYKGIDTACGERHYPAVAEMLRHVSWRQHIHCPGLRLAAFRAKLAPRHEHDVLHLRKLLHGLLFKQITGDSLYAPGLQFLTVLWIGEPGDAKHLLLHASCVNCIDRQSSHGHAHLARYAEYHYVPVKPCHHLYQFGIGNGQDFLQFHRICNVFRIFHATNPRCSKYKNINPLQFLHCCIVALPWEGCCFLFDLLQQSFGG